MPVNRRQFAIGVGGAAWSVAAEAMSSHTRAASTEDPHEAVPLLPDRTSFGVRGLHLNGAYVHPVPAATQAAMALFAKRRYSDVNRAWPSDNPRDEAVQAFASLINASPSDIAVVPNTISGENLVAAALALGPDRGVVTDPFHFHVSLAMYGDLHKRGMPLAVITPKANRIGYADLEAAITPQTKLVAVSWVSSWTGYAHDLKTICEIAHRKDALVYADIIQGAGALPLDVKACGVDFCCGGTYKWLMGDFGIAFLYVRPDRLEQLQRVQFGEDSITRFQCHFLPLDPPGPVGGEWDLGTQARQLFEVGLPSWAGLAAAAASMKYISRIGVDRIVAHRKPLIDRLQTELPRYGFQQLTPPDAAGPSVAFWREGIGEYFNRLTRHDIHVSRGKNRLRISVSVYNSMEDIDRLIAVLRAA